MNILEPSKFVARGPKGERLIIRDGKWVPDSPAFIARGLNGEKLVVRDGQWVPEN